MRFTVLFLLLFGTVISVQQNCYAQRTSAYRDIEFTYRTAIDLYAKQKYSAAAKHFEEVVNHHNGQWNEMSINARYHVALCHLYLFRKDAEYLLLTFLREHPQASQCKTIYFLLGKHYYGDKKYKKAAEYFVQVDKFNLTESQLAEYYFKFGHSNFILGKKEEASVAFNEIKNTENTYQKPAIYYYAHISYEEKKYQVALENFLLIEKESGFNAIVPYYITQIYYFQHNYSKTIEYGLPLLDSVVPKREAELNLVLGASYYNLKKYEQAFPYLEKYSTLGAPGRDESYRLGFCALETKQNQKAITWFNKCVNVNDELAQTALYHMAIAYLRLNKKEEARQTFSICLKMDFNQEIREDAHYNYVKLNYELSYNPYHDAINSVKTYLAKYPDSKRTEEMKTYLVTMFVAGKNYESAYTTLNEIKNKDLALQRSYQLVVFNLGTDYFYKSDPDNAIKYFREVKKYPIDKELNSTSHYWIGEANYNAERWDDAIEGYKRFLEEPGAVNSTYYNRVQYNLGYCYLQKGYLSGNNLRNNSTATIDVAKELYSQGLVHFRTFVDNKNETDNVRKNDANVRIGDIYYIKADNATALTYYDRAYSSNMTSSKDYALYQKAMCAGLTEKPDDKISMMKNLLSTFPKSKYIADAKFEIAETYRVKEDRPNALTYYQKVIKEHPDNYLKVKYSRFEIALIHYRDKEYDKAEKEYKQMLKDYPNQSDIDKTLSGLKPVLADQNRIDEWVNLMKQYGRFDNKKDQADSTYYETAEKLYFDKNYAKAIESFTNYLNQFNPARFEINANFYLAESHTLLNRTAEAVPYYEKVLTYPNNLYTNYTIRKLSRHYYDKGEWVKAIDLYKQIESFSTDDAELLNAVIYILRANYQLKNSSEVFTYAKKLIEFKSASDDQKAEAYFYRAKMAFEANNMNDAAGDFKQVVKLTQKEIKAESGYNLILIKYNNAEYKTVEKDLYDYFKVKPTYNYWLAKGFILLGDNYMQLGDTAQAKATWKSIIDKYAKSDDDIIATAQAKLNALLEAENRMQEQKRMQIRKEEENEVPVNNENEE